MSHTVSMGHRLPSYEGICRSPHGHNIRVEAVLDAPGFTDFKHVADILRHVLEPLDHAMVLHVEDPLLAVLRDMGFRTVALSVEPTTEAVADHVFNQLAARRCAVRRVTVHETERYSATSRSGSDAVRRVWE